MSNVAITSNERQPFVYNPQQKSDNKISRFPSIILQGLEPADKEKVIKGWTEKCKSERIQAAKSIACGAAALLVTATAVSFALHFFILHTITSFFGYSTFGMFRYFTQPTALSILGFGGGLGVIAGGAVAVFNKFIRPHFEEANSHLKKARSIEERLIVAQNPKAEVAQPAPQQKAVQTVATKVLSKKALDENRFKDYAKAIAFGAVAVIACASTAAALYFASKALLYLLIELNFTQFPAYYWWQSSYFLLNSDIATSILSVVLAAEFTTLAGMGLYGMKKVVSKLGEKANENWNKAADNYYNGIVALRMQKEEAADFETAIEKSRLEANMRNDENLMNSETSEEALEPLEGAIG